MSQDVSYCRVHRSRTSPIAGPTGDGILLWSPSKVNLKQRKHLHLFLDFSRFLLLAESGSIFQGIFKFSRL